MYLGSLMFEYVISYLISNGIDVEHSIVYRHLIWRCTKKRRSGQIANNKNNLYHNCFDGGMYEQSPRLMVIWLSI